MRGVIDNKEIPIVSDEHLDLNDMLEEKAMVGKEALGVWFSRCRMEVGDKDVQETDYIMSICIPFPCSSQHCVSRHPICLCFHQ